MPSLSYGSKTIGYTEDKDGLLISMIDMSVVSGFSIARWLKERGTPFLMHTRFPRNHPHFIDFRSEQIWATPSVAIEFVTWVDSPFRSWALNAIIDLRGEADGSGEY